jgi:hypothetical protein
MGGGTDVVRTFEIRRGFQPGNQPDRSDGHFGGGLKEWQGPQVADGAAMIIRPVQCVGGSKRRGLPEDHGEE